jgi:hypothetical protein
MRSRSYSSYSNYHIARRALSTLVIPGMATFLACLCSAQQCSPTPVLTFEGLKNDELVSNYYNGGLGSLGTGPGPNYGITFGSGTMANITELAGGTYRTSNHPSGITDVGFISGAGVIMNVPAGFTTGFSFYYTAPYKGGTIDIFDGLDGGGARLATIQVPTTASTCGPEPYSCYVPKGIAISGVAKSVNFSGVANYVGFDNITVGSVTPGKTSSMAQIASAGGWGTSFSLMNLGSAPVCSSLQFYSDPNGGALSLPLTFPQGAIGPLAASGVSANINQNSLLAVDTTGPTSGNVSVGWGTVQAAGNVNGYGVFTNTPQNWQAVVPLEARNANEYILPFDNSGSLSTGLAIANLWNVQASVTLRILGDNGSQIDSQRILLSPQGHTSFMLASTYPKTAGARGSVHISSQVAGYSYGSQISVLGLRANGPALTTVPVLANVAAGTGSLTHITYNGGWQTTITLVNTGSSPATATLNFYRDDGSPWALPLNLPLSTTTSSTPSVTQTLAAGQTVIMQTLANDNQPSVSGSAVLTSTGAVGGSALFHMDSTGQEGIVPLETRNATAYVLAFDNTDGRITGMALANSTANSANLSVTIRDDTGATIATGSIPVNANGHTQAVLTSSYPATVGKRGTVEIGGPAGFSVLGLFVSPTGNVTTLPTLTR